MDVNWVSNLISALLGLGAGWALRIVYTSVKNRTSINSNNNNYQVEQNKNKVSNGSVVGRDQSNSH